MNHLSQWRIADGFTDEYGTTVVGTSRMLRDAHSERFQVTITGLDGALQDPMEVGKLRDYDEQEGPVVAIGWSCQNVNQLGEVIWDSI
jgi:hypothetical protein